MNRNLLVLFLSFAFALVGTGCGGNSYTNPVNPAGGTLIVNTGDAPNDQIITFELTVSGGTLTGGSNPSVLNKPTEIEFIHNSATFEPLSLTNVPPGTYTGATLTVANPEIVVVDPVSKAITKLTATLTSSMVNITFNPSVTIGSNATVLNLDLNLNSSVTITGTTATVTPTFTVSTASITAGAEANETEDNGELEDLRGTVTGVAAPNFTIQPAQTSQPLTITTDANTKFDDGITSFSQIVTGIIVSVDAVTQSGGGILAKKVESETETANGEEVEGIITGVTCAVAAACPSIANPATSITINTHKLSATSAASAPATTTTVSVPISASTRFKVHSNMSGGSFPAFDASNISKGQRVEVDSANQAANTSTSVSASKIKLLEQGLSGTISAFNAGNFTLTPDPQSAFVSLTGATTVAVQAGSARNKGVTLANNNAVRVRGLLFFNGSSYTMIASRVAP